MNGRGFKGQILVLVAFVGFAMIILLLSIFCCFVVGQSGISFTTMDPFIIPSSNSSINFAINGTYEKASFENGVWSLVNLQFSGFQSAEKLDLKVSAENCEVTIFSCLIYNSTFDGERVRSARLRYSVVGTGEQVFDLGLEPKDGDWGVIIDGDFKGETDGWRVSSDGVLKITGATGNVTCSYYGFPASFLDTRSGGSQIFGQHSVVTTTSVVMALIVLVAVIIRIGKRGSNNLGFDKLIRRSKIK